MSASISPFDLKRHLKQPDLSVEVLPLVDLCLLALIFSFLSSPFIFSPGLGIDLPRSSASSLSELPTAAVLSVNGPNMLLFEGQVYSLATLQPALDTFINRRRTPNPTLLLKMNREVAIQMLLTIADFARKAGFSSVQIAAQSTTSPSREGSVRQKSEPTLRVR